MTRKYWIAMKLHRKITVDNQSYEITDGMFIGLFPVFDDKEKAKDWVGEGGELMEFNCEEMVIEPRN